MVRSIFSRWQAVLFVVILSAQVAQGADSVFPLGNQAQIILPEGYDALDGDQTRAMLSKMGEPSSNQEVGFVVPKEEGQNWSVYFEFDPIGYVKDDEKDKLDADAILESIRRGTEESNKVRRQSNSPEMQITGWHTKPTYNQATKNLEWCVAATVESRPLLNYNIRMLGRDGVMEITLVSDPSSLDADLPKVRSLLNGFSYVSGKNYGDWRAGDKVAEYGLTALVAGGAVAVALKTGLLQKLIKPILIAGAALAALVAKLFGRGKSTS